jgi:hypothetical protein
VEAGKSPGRELINGDCVGLSCLFHPQSRKFAAITPTSGMRQEKKSLGQSPRSNCAPKLHTLSEMAHVAKVIEVAGIKVE